MRSAAKLIQRNPLSNNEHLSDGKIAINPLPDDKILDWSKLKVFADDKLNVTKMIISVFENIVGKGEIACTSNSSFSLSVFKRLLSQRRQKVSLYGNGLSDHCYYPHFHFRHVDSKKSALNQK